MTSTNMKFRLTSDNANYKCDAADTTSLLRVFSPILGTIMKISVKTEGNVESLWGNSSAAQSGNKNNRFLFTKAMEDLANWCEKAEIGDSYSGNGFIVKAIAMR